MNSASPLVLGFDSAGTHCTAAVVRGSEVLAHRLEEMSKGQAERLLGLLGETLEEADSAFSELDAIGVGVGPGNFTGIRISVSAARGLALGLNIPAVGVSGFDALRYGTETACACAIEARRNQIFLQIFQKGGAPSAPFEVASSDIPTHDGPLLGASGLPAKFPTAVAIAKLAIERADRTTERPSPLYIRPADAAPARDAAPQILP